MVQSKTQKPLFCRFFSPYFSVLNPVVESRRAIADISAVNNGAKPTKPADMTQWIMDQSSPNNRYNVAHIVETQMMGSVVAIHTTAMAVSSPFTDTQHCYLLQIDRLLKSCTTSSNILSILPPFERNTSVSWQSIMTSSISQVYRNWRSWTAS